MKTVYRYSLVKQILLFVLINLSTISSEAQNNPFITFNNNQFSYQCEPFYPMIVNYGVVCIQDNLDNYHISPSLGYCHPSFQEPWWICGENSDQWKEEMIEHFIKIESLGFNMVRLIQLVDLRIDADQNVTTNKFYIQDQSNPQIYTLSPTGFIINNNYDFIRQGDLLQEVIDALYLSGTDLKLIVLMGGGKIELEHQLYGDYLEYFASRFRNEPRIFAYDLYNEPCMFRSYDPNYQDKEVLANICYNWYIKIKYNAPAHFITYGCEVYDVFNWDPQLMPFDFLSFHHYERARVEENYEI